MQNYLWEIAAMCGAPERYLVTCSNKTAKYLLANGIVPHVHWIIDPKQSKAADFEVTHEDTEYWLNVGCHPDVFDMVEKQNRKIKVFIAASNVGGEQLDTRECHEAMKEHGVESMVLLAGGMTAGLRAMTLADALGFRKLTYFGFDGCMIDDKCYSYDKGRNEVILEVEAQDGRVFTSTPALSGQAQQFLLWHELLPWIDVEIIGDGFIRHMFELQKNLETYSKYHFSTGYAEIQKEFHKTTEGYGISGKQVAHLVTELHGQVGGTVLDYGCGKQTLAAAVEFDVIGYDPFIEGLDKPPAAADIVVCSDVMEHVEEFCVRGVLDHIQELTKQIAVFHIKIGPAIKTLPDGRNAHITQKPHEWWFKRIKERFIPGNVFETDAALTVIAQAIPAVEEKLYAHR